MLHLLRKSATASFTKRNCATLNIVSGQITIIPKRELMAFLGKSLTKTTIWGDQPAEKGRYNLAISMVFLWINFKNFFMVHQIVVKKKQVWKTHLPHFNNDSNS